MDKNGAKYCGIQDDCKKYPACQDAGCFYNLSNAQAVEKENRELNKAGDKFDDGKPEPNMVLKDMATTLDHWIQVLEFGKKKYARSNWMGEGLSIERCEEAVSRHWLKYLKGEYLDQETGLPHLAHLICEAAFIIEKTEVLNQNGQTI